MIALDFNIIHLPIRWESLIFNRLKILVKTGQGFFNLLNLQSRGSPISSIWTTNLSNSPCSKWWNVLISFFGYVWLLVVFYFHGLCCIIYVFFQMWIAVIKIDLNLYTSWKTFLFAPMNWMWMSASVPALAVSAVLQKHVNLVLFLTYYIVYAKFLAYYWKNLAYNMPHITSYMKNNLSLCDKNLCPYDIVHGNQNFCICFTLTKIVYWIFAAFLFITLPIISSNNVSEKIMKWRNAADYIGHFTCQIHTACSKPWISRFRS